MGNPGKTRGSLGSAEGTEERFTGNRKQWLEWAHAPGACPTGASQELTATKQRTWTRGAGEPSGLAPWSRK